jgi:hypothetical protein
MEDKSGFPVSPRSFLMVFHENGNVDILNKNNVRRIFEAVDAVRNLPKYKTVCARDATGDCPISGVVKFWNSSLSVFQASVLTDEDAIKVG